MYTIKLFADGADIAEITKLRSNNFVGGFTTNPSLMRKAGVKDYLLFARQATEIVHPLPLSLEVFSDNLEEMFEQAIRLSKLGENIFVKIPVTNTRGESTRRISERLNLLGIRLNITAIMTANQIEDYALNLDSEATNIFSVFAGRIADSGRDPIPIMRTSKEILKEFPNSELLWASPREILNLVQAQDVGVDIITMTGELWAKMSLLGKDLLQFSLETVEMFHKDALESSFVI